MAGTPSTMETPEQFSERMMENVFTGFEWLVELLIPAFLVGYFVSFFV